MIARQLHWRQCNDYAILAQARQETVRSFLQSQQPFPSRDGGTGRRSGLKIRRPSGLGGSTPPPGTTLNPKSAQLVTQRCKQGHHLLSDRLWCNSAQTLPKLIERDWIFSLLASLLLTRFQLARHLLAPPPEDQTGQRCCNIQRPSASCDQIGISGFTRSTPHIAIHRSVNTSARQPLRTTKKGRDRSPAPRFQIAV
jgi:hypothetical protein